MKLLFFFGTLCFCTLLKFNVNADPIQPIDDRLNQIIRDALEQLRKDMPTGVRGSGRILSPMTIHNDDTGFNVGELMWLKGWVRNALASGLERFQVITIDTNPSTRRVAYEIRIPDSSTKGTYDLSGYMFDLVPIFGKGGFLVEPKDWSFTGHIDYEINGSGQFIVKDIFIKTMMRSMRSNIEGLLLGGDLGNLMNSIVQDLIVGVLSNLQPQVSDSLKTLLQPQITDLLKEYIKF